MTLATAYAEDLLGLVDTLEEKDVFAPGEAEAWREDIEAADAVSDLARMNDAIVDILDDRDGFDEALDETSHHETDAFY